MFEIDADYCRRLPGNILFSFKNYRITLDDVQNISFCFEWADIKLTLRVAQIEVTLHFPFGSVVQFPVQFANLQF
jgi:hypothetical protein